MKVQKGFTLIEISIVLVIVGLILGGVLKGQALIDSARVRSVINDINGIRAAWYGFQDRFHALPGDYPDASATIHADANDGNGNGEIDTTNEIAGVWHHLAEAGFISGDFDTTASGVTTIEGTECSADSCPQNPYYGFYKIASAQKAADAGNRSIEFFTGDKIPSSVLFQIDQKLDDGKPGSGLFRVHADFSGDCVENDQWKVIEPYRDCAAVLLE
ncbi:type II secretion system protein [Granulosicoccaceae sp. 1_MG-2023]|nr:type II secretion system protein [Granulosicoccaceae sp. 1_MG-2023]